MQAKQSTCFVMIWPQGRRNLDRFYRKTLRPAFVPNLVVIKFNGLSVYKRLHAG